MSIVVDRPDQVFEHISQEDLLSPTTSVNLTDEETLSSANVRQSFAQISIRKPRIVVRGRLSRWASPVLSQLFELVALEANWDSYGAPPVKNQRVVQAFNLLKSIMREDTPGPSIVPTNDGSLQLEWHTAGIDLEVLLLGDNSYNVVFEDHQSGEEWEATLSSDLSRLVDAVSRLSRSQSS